MSDSVRFEPAEQTTQDQPTVSATPLLSPHDNNQATDDLTVERSPMKRKAKDGTRLRGAKHSAPIPDTSDSDEGVSALREELHDARLEIEREKKKAKSLKGEIDSMSAQNISELRKLREEIEILKAEMTGDSNPDRHLAESPSNSSMSAETSHDEGWRTDRRVSDASDSRNSSDSIGATSARARRSKDDLDLVVKRQKPLEKNSPSTRPKKALASESSTSQRPHGSPRPAKSTQIARKPPPPMVRSGTTIEAGSLKPPRHRRTMSDEETEKHDPVLDSMSSKAAKVVSSSISRKRVKKPRTATVEPLNSEEEPQSEVAPTTDSGLGDGGDGSGLVQSATEIRRSSRVQFEDMRISGKLSKLLGSDDTKASKLLGIDVSKAKLIDRMDHSMPRSARASSTLEGKSLPSSPRERSNTAISMPNGMPSFEVQGTMVIQRDVGGTMSIRGGTVSELVRQLVSSTPGIDITSFIQTFLLTYHSFMSPIELLSNLIEQFESASDNELKRNRIVDVFDMWLDDRHHDFFDEKEVYMSFARFLDQQLKPISTSVADKLIAKLEDKRSSHWQKTKRRIGTKLEEEPPLSPGSRDILSFKPRAIATEITMIMSDLFQTIEPMEFLTQHKRKASSKDVSRISVMINQFNLISNWVATEIVKQDQLGKRWKVLQHMMKVALNCQELQNYDTATAITAGMQSAAVARLAHTWQKVHEEKPKLLQKYRALEALLSSEDNSKAYRALVANVKPPAIPFLGVFLKDIVFINDGNPDTLEADFGKKEFINFDKRQKLAGIVLEVKRLQMAAYDFKRENQFRRYLDNFEVLEDIELYNASLVAEARVKRMVKSLSTASTPAEVVAGENTSELAPVSQAP